MPTRESSPAVSRTGNQPESPSFRKSLVRRLWMVLGGLAIAIAFLEGSAWPLAWLGLTPLFAFAPHAERSRTACLDGWILGVVANGMACSWLVQTIVQFGGFPLSIALFFYAALIAFTGLPFVVVAGALRWAGPNASVLLAPTLWVSMEFLFPNFFPWRLAYSQRDLSWLIQVGDLTGPYGLSFVMAWFASALSRARRRPLSLLGPALAIVLLCVYGAVRVDLLRASLARFPVATLGLIQGNLSILEKDNGDRLEANVERYRRLSLQLQPPVDLLIWPETVVGWALPRGLRELGALDPFADAPAPLIFGAPSYSGPPADRSWYNSAFLRATDGTVAGVYDKIVLMPFGEYLPFSDTFPWVQNLSPRTGDFTAGERSEVMEVSPDLRVAVMICYDDMLSDPPRNAVRNGATVLVTLANDAWFGTTAALRLHESLALWRAVENRRYFVRVTNTGLSSVVDPTGGIALSLPIWTETSAAIEVRLIDIPTVYQEFGDVFAWILVAMTPFLLLRSRLR